MVPALITLPFLATRRVDRRLLARVRRGRRPVREPSHPPLPPRRPRPARRCSSRAPRLAVPAPLLCDCGCDRRRRLLRARPARECAPVRRAVGDVRVRAPGARRLGRRVPGRDGRARLCRRHARAHLQRRERGRHLGLPLVPGVQEQEEPEPFATTPGLAPAAQHHVP